MKITRHQARHCIISKVYVNVGCRASHLNKIRSAVKGHKSFIVITQ